MVEVKIESVAYRGAGIARVDGMVWFVPGTCPGEKVLVREVNRRARFVEAEVLEILEPAAGRIEPCCRVEGPGGEMVQVPGCVYDHLDYSLEVDVKQEQFVDFLTRHAGVENVRAICEKPVPSPSSLNYRNKIVLHSGNAGSGRGLGYKMSGTRDIVDIPACPLAVEEINQALGKLRDSARFDRLLKRDEDVTFRWTPGDGALYWVGKAPERAIALHEGTAVGVLEVPADGFSQVNPAVADSLTERVTEILRREKPEALVDLYSGSGIFAFAAARAGVRDVAGIETDLSSVRSARRNASRLGLDVEFACVEAAEGLQTMPGEYRREPLAVIVDPPRRGLDRETLGEILRLRPALLLYISCAPDILTRDLKELLGGGYRVESAQLFDMFPRTAHFETLSVLRG